MFDMYDFTLTVKLSFRCLIFINLISVLGMKLKEILGVATNNILGNGKKRL
jgi:hypothetical protein